jgi:hypothetical protein
MQHAAGGVAEDGGGRVVAALSGQGALQQRLDLAVIGAEHALVQGQVGRVDQAAQIGGVFEQVIEPLQSAAQARVVAGQAGPLLQAAGQRHARAGDVGQGQRAVAGGLPGGEGQGEGGDLGAARVQLQAKQIVAQHRLGGRGRAQPLFFHAHAPQQLEGGHQEVARAAAGIDHGHLGGALRPAGERAGGGGFALTPCPSPMRGEGSETLPLSLGWERGLGGEGHPAQVLKLLYQRAGGVARGPPGAERVVQQELHHVVLGEELGHRGEVGAANLAPAAINLIFLLCLPELVGPAQAVVRGKDRHRQAGEDALQALQIFGGQAHLGGRRAGVEDPGQHARGEASGDLPGVAVAGLQRQVGAVLQAHRRAGGVHQQLILGQEAGEEHAVPLLVGDLLDQQRGAGGHIAVAELAGAGAQGVAQAALIAAEAGGSNLALKGQGGEGGARGGLGGVAGVDHGLLEGAAQVVVKWRHRGLLYTRFCHCFGSRRAWKQASTTT